MRLLVLEMWTHMLADLSLNLARMSFPHHNPVSCPVLIKTLKINKEVTQELSYLYPVI